MQAVLVASLGLAGVALQGGAWLQGQSGQQGKEDGFHGHRQAAIAGTRGGFISLAGKGGAPPPTVNTVRYPGPARHARGIGPNLWLPCQAVPSYPLCPSSCFRKAGPAQGGAALPTLGRFSATPRMRPQSPQHPSQSEQRAQGMEATS